MGLSCSRRLTPGWEKIQADLDDAIFAAGPGRRGTRFLAAEEGGSTAEAEAQGVDKAKVSLVRAEARWLHARNALEQAYDSGDPIRIERAKEEAETEGVDALHLARDRSSSTSALPRRRRCSLDGIGTFLSNRASMCAAIAVLMYEWTAYNLVYLGRILPTVRKDIFVLPFWLMFNISWGLAVWSFIRCHFADPGFLPPRWHEFVQRMGHALPVAPPRMEWQPGKATMCKRCDMPRPERAHHCHVCGCCVLRMDHHCPWINNCVGFGNHKFFLLLVSYCFLSCLIALATSCPELIYCTVVLTKLQSADMWEEEHLRMSDTIVFLIFGLLAMLFAVLLAPMVLTHFELTSYNVTTIEGHYEGGNMPNPFDQGTAASNFAEVFGSYGLDWFLPIHPVQPLSDGICFVRTDDRLCADSVSEAGYDVDWDVAEEQLWRLRYQVQSSSLVANSPRRPASKTRSDSWWWGARQGRSRSASSEAGSIGYPGGNSRVLRDSFGRRIVSI